MIKKLIVFVISYDLVFAVVQPVTDTQAYYYMINSINQTTQLLNSATEQINTLGGIRTVMEDVKDDINDAKSSLEGALENLKNAKENFKNALGDVEISSMTDLNAPRKTTRGTGIAYNDIAKIFDDSFKSADEAFLRGIGGETNLNKFLSLQYKLNKALGMHSIEDFKSVMSEAPSKQTINEYKRQLLIHEYIKDYEKLDFKTKQNLSAQSISDEWKNYFFPQTDKAIKEKEDRAKRIEELAKFVDRSKDVKQSIKTTNMLLFELLQLIQKEYNSALNFRNAMTVMYLQNGTNSSLAAKLKARQKELKKISTSSTPDSLKDTPVNTLNGASPFGIGFRLSNGFRNE